MDKRVIAKVQSFGFSVYMQNPEKDTWLYFTDGTHIGYLQYDRIEGYSLSTVHVPNQKTGTGFQVEQRVSDFDKTMLERCFITTPEWARDEGARRSVVKWRDIDHFRSGSPFNREYKLVDTVTL